MSDSGIGKGADSFFTESDDVESEKERETEKEDHHDNNSSENSSDTKESSTAARNRKQIGMYLPKETAEKLRKAWHLYAAENPDATKNDDFFPEVIKTGLSELGLD